MTAPETGGLRIMGALDAVVIGAAVVIVVLLVMHMRSGTAPQPAPEQAETP